MQMNVVQTYAHKYMDWHRAMDKVVERCFETFLNFLCP